MSFCMDDPKFTSWYMPDQYQSVISHLGNDCSNRAMDVKAIRRSRLRKLIAERFHGINAQLASKIERQPDYVSRLLTEKPRHRRDLGEKLAREIERKVGLPSGWLDIDEASDSLIQQPLGIYNVSEVLQQRLLELFDKLTPPQQEEFMGQLESSVQANIEIVRSLGGRLKGVPREKAAKHLPPAPKKKEHQT